MSGRRAKKERFEQSIATDKLLASDLSFSMYLEKLPIGKALLIECDAIGPRTVRLPIDLGSIEINLESPYSAPESGKIALAIQKLDTGKVIYGVKSTVIFEKKRTLRFDSGSKGFKLLEE